MNNRIQQQCPCGELFLCAKDGVYNNSIFKQFFEENDPAVIAWAQNVLQKIKGTNILPTWINKLDNEDFDSLWGTITHIFAIIVLYTRQYNNIDSNEILFQLFVSDRGLVNDLITTQEEMQYLFNNYTEEFSKRGRKDILSKEGVLLGELLRLIRYNSLDEFIFAELRPENTSWCIGHSSPTWDRTENIVNVTKAYEFEEGVQSLDNYPLLRPMNISLISDENDPEKGIFNAMTFAGTQSVGIDGREDLSKLIVVDPNLTYDISFQLKTSGLENQNIKFGVVGYENENSDPILLGYLVNGEVDSFNYNFNNWSINSETGTIEIVSQSQFNIQKITSNNTPVLYTTISSETEFNFQVNIQGLQEGSSLWFGSDQNNCITLQNGLNTIEYTSQGGNVGFGCSIGNELNIEIEQLAYNRSMWFHTNDYMSVDNEGIYYYIHGILLSYNERYYNVPQLNFTSGRALSLLPSVNYIAPIVIQDRSSDITGQPYIFIYDFKVKPLRLPFKQGYLGQKNVIAAYYKNNAYQSQFTTEEFIKQYLVNYKNVLGSELLGQFEGEEIYQILFKVFSNTNRYIQGATLTLNGQTYKTDVNGEVIVSLPRGTWIYTLESENFETVENTFETTEDTNVYVQMTSSYYERVVTFTVVDKNSNTPISNVKVTFDNKINYTSSSGTVSFNAFPGQYTYTIEYDNYYTQTSTVQVTDNVFIQIQLEPIPYYNVTFRIRDGVNPVSGVSIVVTGDDINEQTGVTNSQGLATGFVLAQGTYHYLATKQGWQTQEDDFTIYNNAVVDIQLQTIPRYNVTFVVNNNGLPLSGANVTFNNITLQTVTDGTATFTEINGTYNWIVSKNEFIQQSGSLIVNNANITQQIELVQMTYNVTFNVVNDKGLPISNANVIVGSETIQTNNQGIAVFQRTSGSYNYIISAQNYYINQGIFVVNSQSSIVDVTLDDMTYNVTFIVQINGQNVSNQPVTLGTQTLATNSRGVVVFDCISGSYDWIIERESYTTQQGKVIVDNQPVSIVIDLQKTQGTLYVTVQDTDTSGAPIEGANVTINGDTKMTMSTGQAGPWQLTVGQWQWTVDCNNYKSAIGNVTVSEGQNSLIILLIKSDEQQYIVSFIVREGTAYLEGVVIQLSNGSILTTDSNGQVQANLLTGQYTYTISYGSFFNQIEGSFNLVNDLLLPIQLIRKTTVVTITVINNLNSQPVEGAVVTFNSQTLLTNSDGQVMFTNVPLSNSSLKCVVNKQPQFDEISSYFVINEENPEFTIELGAELYNAVFTVKDESGKNLSNVTIQMNNKTQLTNTQGQTIFTGLINNSYKWQVFKDVYISKTGTLTIEGKDVYQNITLEKNKAYITYTVQYEDGTVIPGVQVSDNVSTGITNSNGQVSWYVPVGNTYNWKTSSTDYFSETGSYQVQNNDINKSITIILKDAATIEVSVINNTRLQLPILNTVSNGLNDLRVDWGDGNETYGSSIHTYNNSGKYKIRFNFSGNLYNLNWSCALIGNTNQYLTRVLKWFDSDITTTFYEGSFQNCSMLTMIPTFLSSLCEGSAVDFCSGCNNLTTFPDLNFGWADPDFTNTFANSGLVGSINLSTLLNIQNVTSYKSAFENTKITSVTGTLNPSNLGCDISGLFENCISLQSIPTNMNAVYLTDCSYLCYNCTSLTNICSLTCLNNSDFNASYIFTNTLITQIPTQSITGTATQVNLSYAFANCQSLLNVYVDAIKITCNNIVMDYAFSNTSNLYDISGTKIAGGTSYVGTYTYCGLTSIPNGFFNTSLQATDFTNCFSNAINLRQVGMNLLGDNNSVQNMSGFLQNCINLTSVSIDTLLANDRNSVTGPIFSCQNYSNFFKGCINLVTGVLIHGFEQTSSSTFVDQYIYQWANVKTTNGWNEPETPSSIIGTGCYNGCTQVVGYNNIPDDWK